MDNQHKQIKGYRDLSQAEIDLMNTIKEKEAELITLIDAHVVYLSHVIGNGTNEARAHAVHSEALKWAAVAKTNLQLGFMTLIRSVAQPQPK